MIEMWRFNFHHIKIRIEDGARILWNTPSLHWPHVYLAVLIFLLAFTLRTAVAHCWHYTFLGWDERHYLKMAKILFESGYGDGDFWLPGWPCLIGLFHLISVGPRQAVLILGAINCGLVANIASQLWNLRCGLVAGLIMCCLPEHVFYSHYVFAEIGLETIILLFTLLVILGTKRGFSWPLLLCAHFIIGWGLLYKHFAVIPLSAFTIYLFFKGKKFAAVLLVMVSLLPLISFSMYRLNKGLDSLFWVNSPIKSTQEWSKHRPYRNFTVDTRAGVFGRYIRNLRKRSTGYYYRHGYHNIANLWTPNSFVIARFIRKYYGYVSNFREIQFWVVLPYSLILIFGLTGIFFSPPDVFKYYSFGSLLLLTSMGLGWFLVSRYRVPFLFLLVANSAYCLSNFSRIQFNISQSPIFTKIAFAAVLVFIVKIYSGKLPHLGSWY